MHAGLWAPERRALTVGLVSSITLVAVEALAVATVLPDIEDDLGGIGLYGWVFSAFFLGSVIGVVLAGQEADRRGPARPYAIGLGVFAAALVAGGLAPSMLVLVIARGVQGVGAGAVPATAYVAIGRAYSEAHRARMFAVLSTAWVVPGLVGPGLASAVSASFGWRWVFLALPPIVMVSGLVGYRPLRALDVVDGPVVASQLGRATRLALGAAVLLAGLGADDALPAVGLAVAGLAIGLPALRALLPSGTLRAAKGLPAAILARGVLTFAFFGADAYVPLAITDVRGRSTAYAGVVLTLSALSWTAGSWIQARFVGRTGPRPLVAAGHGVLVVATAGIGLGLDRGVPLWVLAAAWTAGGFGIGLAYAPISLAVLAGAAPGGEGAASAALQLSDLLGVAIGTGACGALVALADASGRSRTAGIGAAWALTGAVALAGIVLATRLPTGRAPRAVRYGGID